MKLPRLAALLAALALAACDEELTCPAGETACGRRCVALGSDAANCGACGNACGPGGVCDAGTCACGPGTVACAGTCVDLASDPAHCGACDGAACTAAQVCSAAACAASCGAGLTECGRACVDTSADRYHCGACGTACAAGESCDAGACRSLQVACFATNDVRAVAPDFLTLGPVRATGDGPIALAVLGDRVFAANSLSHSVSALPLAGGPGIETVLAGQDLEFVTARDGLVLVSNSGGGTVIVWDPAAARVLDEIAVGERPSENPRGIAFVGDRAFVALYGEDETSGGQGIAVLDLSGLPTCAAPASSPPPCGSLEKVIDLRAVEGASDAPGLPFPSRVVAAGSKVYVTIANMKKATEGPLAGFYVEPAGPAKLAIVDTADADAISIQQLPAEGRNAGGMTLSGTTLWVACADVAAPGILPVEIAADPVPGSLRALPLGSPGNVAFCGGTGYVTDLWSGKVVSFDPADAASSAALEVCPLSPGEFGFAWAADVACAP
jgi:DNA-binding beta-propeller fold protein YncE